jgi:hypothetical protein
MALGNCLQDATDHVGRVGLISDHQRAAGKVALTPQRLAHQEEESSA